VGLVEGLAVGASAAVAVEARAGAAVKAERVAAVVGQEETEVQEEGGREVRAAMAVLLAKEGIVEAAAEEARAVTVVVVEETVEAVEVLEATAVQVGTAEGSARRGPQREAIKGGEKAPANRQCDASMAGTPGPGPQQWNRRDALGRVSVASFISCPVCGEKA
jgi:hypothetical protein